MHVLQTLPAPSVDLCTETALYVNLHGGAWYSYREAAVVLAAGDSVTTDTYFGVLPVGKWARHTSIRQLVVEVSVDGEIEVDAVQNRSHHAARTVATARGCDRVRLTLPPVDELADGHVYLQIRAVEDGVRFRGFTTMTGDVPQRDPRLGISITTFNRPRYVRSTVARIDRYLTERPELRDRVQLQVIDNGRNLELDPPDTVPCRVVPSRNLGGAGGFARGLMELRDEGWASHVLFMDDDVTFEPEVLGRMLALLAYAVDPLLCISGAMLREEHPHLQFESGAVVLTRSTVVWHAQGHNRDLRSTADLLLNERDEAIDYGGWWCFAFPIDLTPDYPIPIFVRGDDVCFGLKYCAGHLVTVNGIGVWHQDFAYKNGPVAFFYEARNIPLMLTVARPDYDASAFRRRMIERTLRFASAFKYDTAHAFLDGVEAYLDGPEALRALASDDLHDRVRDRYGETLEPLDRHRLSTPEWTPPPGRLPQLWRAMTLVTLGGHLIPGALRRRGTWAVPAGSTPAMATVGAEELVYRHAESGTGFVARRDHRRFRKILLEIRRLSRRITAEFDDVSARWKAAYPDLVSEERWRAEFPRDAPSTARTHG